MRYIPSDIKTSSKNSSSDQLALLVSIVVQHYISHQLPGRSTACEEFELGESLLGQVVESIHQDPASFRLRAHLEDEGCDHWVVGELVGEC